MRPSLLPLSENQPHFANTTDRKAIGLIYDDLSHDDENAKSSKRSEMQIIHQEVANINKIYEQQIIHKI